MNGYRTIVVGFDGSANATDALHHAARLCAPDGTVHVVTAYRRPSDSEVMQVIESLPEQYRQDYDPLSGPEEQLADALAVLAAAGVDHEGHLVEDDAASAILALADDAEAELIVVGSRGLGRTARFLRGSVSTKVAHHATTTFLVVHESDPDDT